MFAVRDGDVQPLDAACPLQPPALLERYGASAKLIWAGEGAHLQRELLQSGEDQGWKLAPHERLAAAVGRLAFQEWNGQRLIEPHELRAKYLRASDAEIKTNG